VDVLRQEVNSKWWNVWFKVPHEARPRLDAHCEGRKINIMDTRAAADKPSHQLEGLAAELYLRCDSAQTLSNLQREFTNSADAADVIENLEQMIAAKLMIEMDGQYLSLAVMRTRTPLSEPGSDYVYANIQQAQAADSLLRLV
jgi:hypothetical protein